MKTIQFNNMQYKVDIQLRQDITILDGDSATGKTMLFDTIKDYTILEGIQNILCINEFTETPDIILSRLRKMYNGIILIDHAERIMKHMEVTKHINNDLNNYYVLIGRSLPVYTDLRYLAIPVITEDIIGVKYKFGN